MNAIVAVGSRTQLILLSGLIAILALPAAVDGQQRDAGERRGETRTDEQAAAGVGVSDVDFFTAIQERQIDVKVVPSSYSSLALRVRNITRTPLKVTLPKTFAAVPLARWQAQQAMQMRGMNVSLGNYFGQANGNSQGLGGSLAGPWWGGDSQQGDDGQQDASRQLTLAPGRFAQAQLPCFCLEFGRPDPHSDIPYIVCPLEQLNNKPAVAELLVQFAQQGIDQHVAQLAAWHLASGTPWQMLAQVKFPRTRTSRGHRVTRAELMAARQLAEALPSFGDQGSLSGQR